MAKKRGVVLPESNFERRQRCVAVDQLHSGTGSAALRPDTERRVWLQRGNRAGGGQLPVLVFFHVA
jgi:hypothetical protein